LEQNVDAQSNDLQAWIVPFQDVQQAITLILGNIRDNGIITEEVAQAGFFQLALDKNQTAQLLRISVDQTYPYFAEISGGKHRFSIRFMKPSRDENRPSQSNRTVPFLLTRCLF
jgi:cell division protein ZapD